MKSLGVAVATWIEVVRQPAYFLVLSIVSMLLFASSWIMLSGFVAGREGQIIRETAVAGAVIGGLFVVFLTVPGSIAEEIRTKQMLAILAKPISGFELVLGKFLGVAAALGLAFLCFGAAFIASVWIKEGAAWVPGLLHAYFLGLLQAGVLAALVLFFSVFLPVPAAVLCGAASFAVGNLAPMLAKNIETLQGPLRWGGEALLLFVPNFFRLNAAFDFGVGREASAIYLSIAALYATVYTLTVLLAAGWIVSRKEIV